jgi:hypothetical protein
MIIKAVKHLPDYQPKPSEKLIRGNDGRVIVFNLLPLGRGRLNTFILTYLTQNLFSEIIKEKSINFELSIIL